MDSRAAVITGASSGLGAELARQLAALGAPVGLTARCADDLEALAAAIRAAGGTAVTAPADAADPEATRTAIARLADRLGPIDLLIANAGIALHTPGLVFAPEDVEGMVRVNLLGAVHAIGAVLPGMLERGQGHLVGISSLAAYRGLPRSAGYCATKAALTAFLESLRVDLQGRGITVTTVHPGYVRTPMTEGADFAQPFRLEAGPAVRIIQRGITAGRREINFPWPLAKLMALVRHLPNPVYDRLARLIIA